jgi:hypothetical protein
MLPPAGKDHGAFRIIIVAAANADPYPQHGAAIAALAATLAELAVARGEVSPPLWEHGLILRYAAMVVPAVFHGTAIVFMALFRHLAGIERVH